VPRKTAPRTTVGRGGEMLIVPGPSPPVQHVSSKILRPVSNRILCPQHPCGGAISATVSSLAPESREEARHWMSGTEFSSMQSWRFMSAGPDSHPSTTCSCLGRKRTAQIAVSLALPVAEFFQSFRRMEVERGWPAAMQVWSAADRRGGAASCGLETPKPERIRLQRGLPREHRSGWNCTPKSGGPMPNSHHLSASGQRRFSSSWGAPPVPSEGLIAARLEGRSYTRERALPSWWTRISCLTGNGGAAHVPPKTAPMHDVPRQTPVNGIFAGEFATEAWADSRTSGPPGRARGRGDPEREPDSSTVMYRLDPFTRRGRKGYATRWLREGIVNCREQNLVGRSLCGSLQGCGDDIRVAEGAKKRPCLVLRLLDSPSGSNQHDAAPAGPMDVP
jgi:hypothetical protein